MPAPQQFAAFISYSHSLLDFDAAKRLYRLLETYVFPAGFGAYTNFLAGWVRSSVTKKNSPPHRS
jgi:hypothetical protein